MYREGYCVSGSGINCNDVNWNEELIFFLVKTEKKLEDIKNIADEYHKLSDIDWYESNGPYFAIGQYAFVMDVISLMEDIQLHLVDDYIFFPAQMPWSLTEKEKELTSKELKNIFKRYVKEDSIVDLKDLYFTEDD